MNKVLVTLILGVGLTGAVLTISISLLFEPPIGNVLRMVTAVSALAFVTFTFSALVFHQ